MGNWGYFTPVLGVMGLITAEFLGPPCTSRMRIWYIGMWCVYITPRNKNGPGLPRSTTKSLVKSSVRFRQKKIHWIPKRARLEARNFLIYLGSCEKHCFTVDHESVHLGHENQNFLFLQQHQERQEGKKQPLLLDSLRPRHEGRARRRNRWWLDPWSFSWLFRVKSEVHFR